MNGTGQAEDILGQAGKLLDLIGYQNHAVVSRELISKGTGTITAFAFDKGQGLSEHTAPFDAFVYVSEGKVEITIEGKANQLSTGDVIIMPANKAHALKAIEAFKMLLVMIKS